MAEWTTPKTDWDSNDGITDSDFNRIEENAEVLRRTWEVSSNIGGENNFDVGAGVERLVYIVQHTVPAGYKLVLRRCKYTLTAGDQWRAIVQSYEGSTPLVTWTSSARIGDETPDTVIADNSAGGTALDIFVELHVKNTHSGTLSLRYYSGMYAQFEDVLETTTTTTAGA